MSHPLRHDHEKPRRWYLPMAARDPSEEHRAATPLELFFDLCFVVAIALAASNLHHEIAEDHIADGVFAFAMVFFAIWWAWMNFTWFASAFDIDDGVYRVTTFVQMSGALLMAAGVPRVFESSDLDLMTAGYVIMRLALSAHWLRAAQSDPVQRTAALRYALLVAGVQILWVARLALDGDLAIASILVLVAVELMVPVVAEGAMKTSWHPHHIAERYGLLTIIVLGESVLAATLAFQSAFDEDFADPRLLALAVSALVIVFSMWWLYFDEAEHPEPGSLSAALKWGYGHLLIFAAAAAVGAAIALAVDQKTHRTEVGDVTAGLALTVPVALYLLGVWFIHVLPNRDGWMVAAFPIAAVLVLATAAGGLWALPGAAFILAALVGLMQYEEERLESHSESPADSARDL